MYHAAGTGLTIIVLYILSYLFYRNRFFSLQFHRRLWNLILTFAFIFTALAGLLLALQITYKWEIPIIKAILKWHVEIGIGMCVTGFLHFFWHLSYFREIFRRKDPEVDNHTSLTLAQKSEIPVNLFIIGFLSTAVQLLLLKEIINISGGYELITGTFLFSWLAGSSAGSRLAIKSSLNDPGRLILWFVSGPLIAILLIMFLSRLFMNPGETPSFMAGTVFSMIVLLPFSLLTGFAFIKMVSANMNAGYSAGKSFSLETSGGVTAGIIVTVFSSGWLNTYQSLLLLEILGLTYALLTYYIRKGRNKVIVQAAALILIIPVIVLSPDILFRQFLLRGSGIEETTDTPYGNITKSTFHGEKNVYYDQRLIIYNNDAVESEEDIHYALLQADNPDKVLLISGPVKSRIKEIKKYNVNKIVYVERDPALAGIEEPDPETEGLLVVKNNDAISFIKKTEEKFDAVLLLAAPPSTLSLNRYYSQEFFSAVREKMNAGAVFSCSPGINPNYFNKEAVKYYSSVYNSLKSVFRNVLPVSGNKIYFIASDKDLTTSFCRLVTEKGISNTYVSPDYLSDDLTSAKSDEVSSLMDHSITINTYFNPIGCFYYQDLNLSKDVRAKTVSMVLLSVIFLLTLTTIRRINGIMYFGSFALAGYEIILILILQITIGNMYQVTGLILAGMMTGLATGAGFDFPLTGRLRIEFKALILMLLYLFAAFFLKELVSAGNSFQVVFIIVLSGFLPSVITGSIFRQLTSDQPGTTMSSVVYSADLSGAAAGFLFFSGVIIPITGIGLSLFLIPALIFTGFIFIIISK